MARKWYSASYDGGGRSNACAIDPQAAGNCAIAGDVWGPRVTANSGDLWEPKLQGTNGIGQIYGRAVEYSIKHPGRTYWGIGTLTGGGGFLGMQDPADRQLVKLNTTWGWGSNLPSGTGSFWPRAVGNTIVVDYDSGTGTEYLYGLARNGIFRAVDTGSGLASFTAISGTTPLNGAGKSMTLASDGSLYAIDWGNRTSNTAVTGQTMWRITNPRTSPVVSTITGPLGAGPWNELRTISGTVWCVCASGLFKLVGGSWVAASGSGLITGSGSILSSIGGVGQTLYCALGQHPAGTGQTCAKSTDGGATWSYVTTSSTVSNIVQGTTRPWWLMVFDTSRGLLSDHNGVNEMRVDPNNVNYVLLAGESGAWTSRDGGASWHPSVNGLMGSEVSNIGLGATGEAWNNDTDWGTIHTLDHYATVAEVSSSKTAHTYTAASLNRTVVTSSDGLSHVFAVTWTGSFWDVTQDGTSVSDAFSKGAIVNPTDLQVDPDGVIYVGQYGGGVVVGDPRTVTAVAPTNGSPTLDTTNPIVGTPLHVLVNDPTWDGTHPLTYTYQWQEE